MQRSPKKLEPGELISVNHVSNGNFGTYVGSQQMIKFSTSIYLCTLFGLDQFAVEVDETLLQPVTIPNWATMEYACVLVPHLFIYENWKTKYVGNRYTILSSNWYFLNKEFTYQLPNPPDFDDLK